MLWNWGVQILVEILSRKHFIFNKFLKRHSMLLLYSKRLLQDLVDLLIGYTIVYDLINLRLTLVNHCHLPITVKPQPNLPQIPYQLTILIRMIKKLCIIICFLILWAVDPPVTYDMLHPPVVVLVAAHLVELYLTGILLVRLEVQYDINEVDHSLYWLLSREAHGFDGFKSLVELEIWQVHVGLVGFLE